MDLRELGDAAKIAADLTMNVDQNRSLFVRWEPLRDNVSQFRAECLGFQYQVQGLLNEMETLYDVLHMEAKQLERRYAMLEDKFEQIHHQNEDLTREIRQLRELIDRRGETVTELVE